MASADAIRAGRADVEIGGDDSPLRAVLRAVQERVAAVGQKIRNIGAGIMGAGLAIGGPLVAASLLFGEMGDELSNMSDRTGVAIQTLDELRFAAMQSGASAEELEAGLRKAADFIGSGMTPAKLQLLEELGLNLADLQKMTPDEAFLAFSEAISKIEDPFKRTSAAMDIFGKAGTRLLPMMKDGADGIRKLQEQFRPFAMTEEEARAGDEYGDKIDEIKVILKNVVAIIGSAVAPVLTDLIDLFKEVITPIIGWVRENKTLFAWLMKIAVGAVAVGSALVAIGSVFSVVAFAFGGLSAVISAIGAVASFLAIPLLALVGIAASLVTPFLALWGVLSLLGMGFGDLWDVMVSVWESITEGVDWVSVLTVAVIPFLPLILAVAAGVAAVVIAFEYLPDILDAVKNGFDVLSGAVAEVFNAGLAAMSAFNDALMAMYSWIIESMAPGITETLGDIWGGIVESASGAFEELKVIVGSAVDTIGEIVSDFTAAFGGISDAIAVGDWAGAFNIGWLAVQLAIERAKNWVLTQWSDLKFNMLSLWDSMIQALAPALQPIIRGIVTMFFNLAQSIADIINRIVRLLPEDLVPAALRTPISFTEQRERALSAVDGTFAAGPARTRDAVDLTEQNRLQAELDAANARAAQARENAGWEYGYWDDFEARQAPMSPMMQAVTPGASFASFSAAALSQVGASSEAERTATAVEALVPLANAQLDRLDRIANEEGGVPTT